MYRALAEDAFDVAILVVGSRDYLPALQRLRQAGKQVVVASIWGSCAREYTEADDGGVTDYDAVWLDDLHSVVEKKELPPPEPMPVSNEGVYTRRLEPTDGGYAGASPTLHPGAPSRPTGTERSVTAS